MVLYMHKILARNQRAMLETFRTPVGHLSGLVQILIP